MKHLTIYRVVVDLPALFRVPVEPYRLGVYSLHQADRVHLACLLEDAEAWLTGPEWRAYLRLLAELVRRNCHRLGLVARLLFDAVDFDVIPMSPQDILTALGSRLRASCLASRATGEGCMACALRAQQGHKHPRQAARRALRAMLAHAHLAPSLDEPRLSPASRGSRWLPQAEEREERPGRARRLADSPLATAA